MIFKNQTPCVEDFLQIPVFVFAFSRVEFLDFLHACVAQGFSEMFNLVISVVAFDGLQYVFYLFVVHLLFESNGFCRRNMRDNVRGSNQHCKRNAGCANVYQQPIADIERNRHIGNVVGFGIERN